MIYYIQLGIEHILDIEALDHLCFIVSFSLLYSLAEWRSIVGLVTAFTVGHSLTLALAAFDIIPIDITLVEFLIPITILFSCGVNLWVLFQASLSTPKKVYLLYPVILFFGLIHGMGFSNFLSVMLFEGDSVLIPLLSFNIGIELAQLIIVLVVLAFLSLSDRLTKQGWWVRMGLNMAVIIFVVRMIIT